MLKASFFEIEITTTQPSAIDSESIKPLSVLHSGLKREWYPIQNTLFFTRMF